MDNPTPSRGPALVFTTRYLRKAPRRIALRTSSIAIPGTYQLSRVVGAAFGALLLAIPGATIRAITGSWYPLFVLLPLGALAGIAATTWRSSTGETATQWAFLFLAKRSGLVKVNKCWVRAYAGACRLPRAAFGPVQVHADSVETLTAAEFHGRYITSAPVRPRSRALDPHTEDVAPTRSERIELARRNAAKRLFDFLTKSGAMFRDARTVRRQQKRRARRVESRTDSARRPPSRSGMSAATRYDRQPGESGKTTPASPTSTFVRPYRRESTKGKP